MSHYFIEDKNQKENIKNIKYTIKNTDFEFVTDTGLFSKDHVDPATDIMLNAMPEISGTLLDLGCGYGCIGIVLNKLYDVDVTQVDVNAKAIEFTKRNADKNGVESKQLISDCFDSITESYDTITLNPPIHAGKAITYKMYEQSIEHLNKGGKFYVVTLKKHGAESTKKKLTDIYKNCETIYKKKSHYVFCCEKK